MRVSRELSVLEIWCREQKMFVFTYKPDIRGEPARPDPARPGPTVTIFDRLYLRNGLMNRSKKLTQYTSTQSILCINFSAKNLKKFRNYSLFTKN